MASQRLAGRNDDDLKWYVLYNVGQSVSQNVDRTEIAQRVWGEKKCEWVSEFTHWPLNLAVYFVRDGHISDVHEWWGSVL